jgi:hypothetical protein
MIFLKKNTRASLALLLFVVAAAFGAWKVHVFYRESELNHEIDRMIENARTTADLPIRADPSVRAELSRLLAKDRQSEVNQALCTYERYRSRIEERLARSGLPRSLSVISFVETAFAKGERSDIVGVWHLSIQLAQQLGLVVGDGLDERANLEKETEAAIKYFVTFYEMFQDWFLVILGNDLGEGIVLSEMRKLKTTNAWRIGESLSPGYAYLDRVMAAIIILQNRHCLSGASLMSDGFPREAILTQAMRTERDP